MQFLCLALNSTSKLNYSLKDLSIQWSENDVNNRGFEIRFTEN